MKRITSCLLLLAASLSLGACAYTGDPRQGGLYGWSEGMAVDRQVEKRQQLADIEADTAYQEQRAQELEARVAKKEKQLKAAR